MLGHVRDDDTFDAEHPTDPLGCRGGQITKDGLVMQVKYRCDSLDCNGSSATLGRSKGRIV